MITLLYGPNTYLKRQRVRQLVADFTVQHGADGVERYDGESLEPGALPGLFQGVSLFAADKLVLIRDAATNKPLWEALEPYAQDGDPTTHIVLIEREPDKRTKTFKSLQKAGHVIECKEVSEGEATGWLVERSAGKLDRQLAAVVVRRVGVDQQRLANELEKLLLHETIDESLIERLVEPSPEGTAFELLDAALNGDTKRAGELIGHLRISEDPYRFFGLLVSNLQVLAALVADTVKTPQQVASDIGVHPFVATKLSRSRRSTRIADVRRMADVLADTDEALKTTGQDPWTLLQIAVTKIAAPRT